MSHHLAPQKPVGQVPAKGLVRDIGGIEFLGDPRLGSTPARIDDPHDLQIGGMGRQPRPQTRAIQQRLRRLQKGGCAQIRAGRDRASRDRWCGIKAQHRKSGRPKDAGRRQPRNAAARDDDIVIKTSHCAALLSDR